MFYQKRNVKESFKKRLKKKFKKKVFQLLEKAMWPKILGQKSDNL